MDRMWTGKREPRDSLRCRLANCCYTATRANAPLASASWSTLRAIPGHQLALISLASIRGARLCRSTPLVGLKCSRQLQREVENQRPLAATVPGFSGIRNYNPQVTGYDPR